MAADSLQLRVDREPVSMANMDDLEASLGLAAYDAAYPELATTWSLPMATQAAAMPNVEVFHASGRRPTS